MTNSTPNHLETNLRNIGLKKNESEIYLYLLKNGLSTPPQIAKGTGILRTNCYNILNELQGRGLISKEKRGKRESFIARDPDALKNELAEKLESVDRILPDLRNLYKSQINKPIIRFFETFEEVKQIYEMTLEADSIYALGSTEQLDNINSSFFEEYIRKVEQRKIIFHDILTNDSKGKSTEIIKSLRGQLHQIKYLPKNINDPLTDILLWDNKLALISLNEPVFGTIIESEPLSVTFKIIMKLLWENLQN